MKDLSGTTTHTIKSWLVKKNGNIFGVIHTQEDHDEIIKNIKSKGYTTNGFGIYKNGHQTIDLEMLKNQTIYNNFSNII
jgi:hypothetical protein